MLPRRKRAKKISLVPLFLRHGLTRSVLHVTTSPVEARQLRDRREAKNKSAVSGAATGRAFAENIGTWSCIWAVYVRFWQVSSVESFRRNAFGAGGR